MHTSVHAVCRLRVYILYQVSSFNLGTAFDTKVAQPWHHAHTARDRQARRNCQHQVRCRANGCPAAVCDSPCYNIRAPDHFGGETTGTPPPISAFPQGKHLLHTTCVRSVYADHDVSSCITCMSATTPLSRDVGTATCSDHSVQAMAPHDHPPPPPPL